MDRIARIREGAHKLFPPPAVPVSSDAGRATAGGWGLSEMTWG